MTTQGWSRIGRALRHRNYRRFFAGQAVWLIGTWMQQTALSWLVYDRYRDPLLMGLVAFAGQIPGLVLLPLAGVLVDAWDRRRVVIAAQALMLAQALTLAALTGLGLLNLPLIIGL